MEHWEDLPAYWSHLKLQDLLAIFWILIMVLFTITNNLLFASFIESKPAGRKTVIARVNLTTSQVTSSCTIILYFAFLLRIMFGPFTNFGVVACHYGVRATIVSFVAMLTFSTILKTLFIIDFNRMAVVPEQNVMICMSLVTFICTLAHLVQEAVVRRIRGLDHFGRSSIFIYLGKGNIDVPMIEKGGTGELLVYPLVGLLISFIVLMVIRSQSKRTLIQKYHNIVSDSPANGRTHYICIIAFFIIGLSVAVGSNIRTLYPKQTDVTQFFEHNEDGIPIGMFLANTMHTLLGSTFFLWNIEFRQFIYRKVSTNCYNRSCMRVLSSSTVNCFQESETVDNSDTFQDTNDIFLNNEKKKNKHKFNAPLKNQNKTIKPPLKPITTKHSILKTSIPSSVLVVREAGQ